MAKRRSSGRRRGKGGALNRAKQDVKSLAKSIGSFIPGVGTLLSIESVYSDGKKLMDSGPKAVKSIFSFDLSLGSKRKRRSSKKSRR